jgi:N-acyl-D-aspartate/D-glutamate deacylase
MASSVNEMGIIDQAIARMTGAAARALGLEDRGLLRARA